MTTSVGISLGTNMEIHSEKHGFEPLVPPARTKPVEADEVLFMFKLSKPPGGGE